MQIVACKSIPQLGQTGDLGRKTNKAADTTELKATIPTTYKSTNRIGPIGIDPTEEPAIANSINNAAKKSLTFTSWELTPELFMQMP